jgi:glycosyltransferase involved in cell wall biosynthesis
MNILCLQSKGQNPKNAKYGEGWQLALKKLDHDVKCYGSGYPWQKGLKIDHSDLKIDLAILLADYPDGDWYKDMSVLKCPKVFVSMDSHMCLNRHVEMAKECKIDLVCAANVSDVPVFSEITKSVWMPNMYSSDLIDNSDRKERFNIGFCGNYANRRRDIRKLGMALGLKKDIGVIGDDMSRAIKSYRIHWNRNIKTDINCRTFETLGCGTFLLTNRTPGVEDLFEHEKHLVYYEDINDCIDKARYYLRNDRVRNKIADAGHKHVLANHTYDVRAKELVELVGKL